MSEQMTIDKSVLFEITEMKRAHSALESALPHRKPVSVAVTSALPGEGKTTLVAGFAALSAREDGRRVLAMDLNWHAPCLHRLFGADLIDPDLALNGAPLQRLVHHVPEFNLDVLPAIQENFFTRGNGAEQLLAEQLLDKARQSYDMIFVDTSKVFPLNRHMIDPVAVANKSDGVALIIASGKTPRQEVKRAQFVLQSAGAHLLGVIINNWQNPLS